MEWGALPAQSRTAQAAALRAVAARVALGGRAGRTGSQTQLPQLLRALVSRLPSAFHCLSPHC